MEGYWEIERGRGGEGASSLVFLSSYLSLGSSYDITTSTAAAEESVGC